MPDHEQISKLAAYLNVTPAHLLHGDPIDHEHIDRCHHLFALATGLETGDVDAMIRLATSILATKM
ncbi:hypothetical protein MY55_21280 [Chromobacterium subtsugae]|nr:hypothetical protein MY55_21280 [Chromobacterium subtsugae]